MEVNDDQLQAPSASRTLPTEQKARGCADRISVSILHSKRLASLKVLLFPYYHTSIPHTCAHTRMHWCGGYVTSH